LQLGAAAHSQPAEEKALAVVLWATLSRNAPGDGEAVDKIMSRYAPRKIPLPPPAAACAKATQTPSAHLAIPANPAPAATVAAQSRFKQRRVTQRGEPSRMLNAGDLQHTLVVCQEAGLLRKEPKCEVLAAAGAVGMRRTFGGASHRAASARAATGCVMAAGARRRPQQPSHLSHLRAAVPKYKPATTAVFRELPATAAEAEAKRMVLAQFGTSLKDFLGSTASAFLHKMLAPEDGADQEAARGSMDRDSVGEAAEKTYMEA
jgi:hypothetical protein